MPVKPKKSAKLSDAERHKHFVKLAREVEASEDPKDLDRALKVVAHSRVKTPG